MNEQSSKTLHVDSSSNSRRSLNEYLKEVETLSGIDELTALYREFNDDVGAVMDRRQSIKREIKRLKNEDKRLAANYPDIAPDVRKLIALRIGEIELGEK